jgi:hypothetical protein
MARSKAGIPVIAARRICVSAGNLKGAGRVCQQTFIDTYTKILTPRLLAPSSTIARPRSWRPLHDRVIPFFDSHDVKLPRVLAGRGSEYCGNPERHEYLPRDRGYRVTPAPRPRARKRR